MSKSPSARRTVARLLGASFAVAALLGTINLNFAQTDPANALDLPTWADVQAAKSNEAAAAAKVRQIEGLIAQLQQQVAATQAEAERTMGIYTQAEADYMAADARFQGLTAEAEASAAQAEEASEQAAILAAQLYRAGGVDQSIELFLDDDAAAADVLLSKLAMMSKATERNTTIYQSAQTAANNATSLGQQAEVAKGEREQLKVAAEEAMAAAAAAAASAQATLAQQQEQQETLNAQLAALKDTTATTVAGYQERVRIEDERRREAERRAAEERARQQAAWAAANPGAGSVSSGGWVRPSGGWVSGTFGWCSNAFCSGNSHTGIDLALGCGNPVYAASGGTVIFSGWAGMGGNMIYINHPDGTQTRYAHMQALYVGFGQTVATGRVIGAVGTTGASTGCHLHYETLQGGRFVDPRPFMAARGVSI